MELAQYEHYIERLIGDLGADDRVVGLIGLGSTARNARQPDRWSDHDIWVVVEDGNEPTFRDDPSWLPDAGRIVLWMQETPHGMKAVYDDGHLVKVAVFRVDELEATRANDYRVYLDREQITGRMRRIREATAHPDSEWLNGPGYLAGQFLTNLLVGVSRFARGERLSAHDFVVAQGVGHLLGLVAAVVPPERDGELDDLNPWRRFETAYPSLATRIERVIRLPIPEAALALADLAQVRVAPHFTGYPTEAAAVIRAALEEMLAADEWNGVSGGEAVPG